jgi:type IV pilus assembly protein PilA
MIVVAIIGVLASLAIYGVARYLKHAKTAEATRAIGAIETGARQQYQRETPFTGDSDKFVHTFCETAPLTPATVPAARKLKVPGALWDARGWQCLKFSMNDPQFYAYKHDSNAAEGTAAIYTASAIGDLDGNGVTSLFELVGHGGSYGDAVRDSFRVIDEDE